MARKPDYGIDSPAIVIGLLVMGALALAASLIFPRVFGLHVRWVELIAAAYFLIGALGMVTYSKSGKLDIRDRVLGAIPWRGDESVLDVGCGRGLLLLGAAQRLRTGKAVGVDIWLPGAITGNKPDAIRENASLAGVSDRLRLAAGDARRLPFQNASFDVVVSNYVIHEVNTAEQRDALISEMVRVLKPGGRFAAVDFIFTKECVETLQRAGIQDAARTPMTGIAYWLSAIMFLGTTRTFIVTASKPA